MPTTTGSTASRCEGLGAIFIFTDFWFTSLRVVVKPKWYFTSPSKSSSANSFPSNSEKICDAGFPNTLVSTLSRPRCAMPKTTSSTPISVPRWSIKSRPGIKASAPSMEKRFWPTNLVFKKDSKATASFSLCRIWRFSAGLSEGVLSLG